MMIDPETEEAERILNQVLERTLQAKPTEPFAYIYAYLIGLSRGEDEPCPLSDEEVMELHSLNIREAELK